ncbi:hypothetical protein B0H13DRAFT_1866897 [Mycena leptocephala]|nr:hypothetical protein B0H13DRAFT_1866897 [Mycena leptocephala]
MGDNVAQLLPSMFIGSLSLIPNDTLRYSVLLTAGLGLIYVLHLERPSVQLRQLDDTINKTEEIIQNAKALCSRDLLRLIAEGVRLLEIQRSASIIQCRILETNTFTWKKYRLLSRVIADCTKGVKKIRITVQLIVEAERQRKFTDDINATEAFLRSVQCYMHQVTILMFLIFPNNPTWKRLTGICIACRQPAINLKVALWVTIHLFKPLIEGIRKVFRQIEIYSECAWPQSSNAEFAAFAGITLRRDRSREASVYPVILGSVFMIFDKLKQQCPQKRNDFVSTKPFASRTRNPLPRSDMGWKGGDIYGVARVSSVAFHSESFS